eukprot:CAMPEP_0201717874 /NCGR_PEP_ID=MMETSP0593-20130828/3543_1 /ASSEMBLY_ACC=CAM_ASM_000672 /TAXON_ID=267983 /ORGANISM="Skeletonema japonicum, Strain CCMP2506" /LENGTH=123 /DNA_ID=CAMNT_0048208049 /DNA_START=15 /DNA_END=386 /DNA_ORIENTATION=+
MVDDNNYRKDAKRQKLLSDQRSAYEEDMARINAALNEQPGQPPAATDREEEKNENSGVTEQPQQPQQQQQQGGHESDEEEDGNWLNNFTPHHTRVGENFQVTDLPTPSATSHSTSAAAIIPKQ